MTTATLHPQFPMFGVQDPRLVHNVGQLIQLVAAQAGCITDFGPDQRTSLLAGDHAVEVPSAVEMSLQLSPSAWF
jgi:hypothetical protein